MQNGYNENITATNNVQSNAPTIVQTDVGAKDGQNKCPRCGATEISLNVNTGKLKCRYCRCEFEPQKIDGLDGEVSQLQGQVIGSGATDIVADTNDMVTFKCSSCGSEVVVDTSSSTQARCHWCRNTLSVNQQIPNGSVPDVVLPFSVKKDEAKIEIEKFVGKRKFFANPKFQKEFTTDNIMGVYFPYMLVDVNSHVNFSGQGEKLVRTYTRGSDDNKKRYYDADLYNVIRDFDLTVDDLTVESSTDKLNNNQGGKTNNVINAIMPFDTENCVKWNANYIKGFSSEKRDVNIAQLSPLVENQVRDIARFSANNTLKEYDRGVSWNNEQLVIKGQQWKSAYLPVWLYSYQQVSGNKKILHYVAVNARTKETMGSVPVDIPKLLLFSFLVEILGFMGMFFVDWDYSFIFLSLGIIFFMVMFLRYRNSNARHKHELETKSNMMSVTGSDVFVEHRNGLRNSRMYGANNTAVYGSTAGGGVINSINAENLSKGIVNVITNNSASATIIKNNNVQNAPTNMQAFNNEVKQLKENPEIQKKSNIVGIIIIIIIMIIVALFVFRMISGNYMEPSVDDDNFIVENNDNNNIENDLEDFYPVSLGEVALGTNLSFDENGAFLFNISDVQSSSSESVVVTGNVIRGTLEVMDTIQIVGLKEPEEVVVIGIEVDSKKVDKTKIGDSNVSLILSNKTVDDVSVGQVLAKSYSIVATKKIEIDITFLTKEEGGRHIPFFNGQYFNFSIMGNIFNGKVTLSDDIEMIMPGDSTTLVINFEEFVALEEGLDILALESEKNIGSGKITKVYR